MEHYMKSNIIYKCGLLCENVVFPKQGKAQNFKLKSKLPTKKEECDFIKNLKPSEKQYTVVQLKTPEELWNNGNWKGVCYDNWFKVKLRKWFNRIKNFEYFD